MRALEAQAQINEADTSRWQYRLAGTGLLLAGNVSDLVVTGRGELSNNGKNSGVFSNTSYTYRLSEGESTASEVYSRNILYYHQRRRIYPYLIGNFWRSKRRGIYDQFQIGPGVAFRLLGAKNNYLRVGGSPVNFEATRYENNYIGDTPHTSSTLYQLRSIYFISGLHALVEGGPRIVYEINWQPSLQQNFQRLYSLVGMEIPITRILALRGNMEYIYENQVLPDHYRTDLLVTFGLTVSNIFKERKQDIEGASE